MRRTSRPFRPAAPAVVELAAGGIVHRDSDGAVLLLHHAAERRWCLPKGHVDPGESLRTAARREIEEEAGLRRLRMGPEIATVSYRFYDPGRRVNVVKVVVYFRVASTSSVPRLEPTFDGFAWLPVAAARRRVPYAVDRSVLDADADRPTRRIRRETATGRGSRPGSGRRAGSARTGP
ncbi:MAG TPA: NUDIX domain-containing protein [Thermoplasmata archaeon]|nr:NUDIX domain-containing protein [Thermoplasmata archaeon]